MDQITSAQARNALVGVRGTIGVLALLFPRFAGRLFGIDPDENPAVPYVARLFGARELFMAAPFLDESMEDVQDYALRAGVAVDSADVVAGLFAGARGYLGKRATLMVTSTAAVAALLGLKALDEI